MARHYEQWARGRANFINQRFGRAIKRQIKQTPFPLSMLIGIAIQETGYLWSGLASKGITGENFLELLIADQKSFSQRTQWPQTKTQLLKENGGDQVFQAARQVLKKRAAYSRAVTDFARDPDNIMMGYGIFQYDIGFVKWAGPDFFVERRWRNLNSCIEVLLKELRKRQMRLGLNRKNLTQYEMALIATAYNRGMGRFVPSLALRQGPMTEGYYYGQRVFDFIGYARGITGERFSDKRLKAVG